MLMEFKVKEDNYNSLLKRKEVLIEVDHEASGTPSRIELKKAVAAKYGTKPENVYVIDVETKTGTQNAICQLQVYDDLQSAKIVPKYIQVRDLPPEERKQTKEQKAKKKEEKPKEEKPKEGKGKPEKGKEEKPKHEQKKEEKPAAPEAPKKGKEGAAQ
jgi:ribosomal protein S24E